MNKKPNNEMRIYGENACMAVFKKRPNDIIQLFFTKEKSTTLREVTSFLSKNKKAYHQITREEISKMTKATHHEDIAMLIRKKNDLTLDQYLKQKKDRSLLIVLDDVSNPHNVGAILRTAAHFQVSGLIVQSKKLADTASAIRVSEGGYEYINIFETDNIKNTLLELHQNSYQIITTSSHAQKKLTDLKWNKFAVIVFGEEANGLSKEILKCGESIKIPGSDFVESLNVSVATSILMYDYFAKNIK